MRVILPTIRHDAAGFGHLSELAAQTDACFFDRIEIDMHEAKWFDADMCAAFGAILYRTSRNLNTVDLVNIPPDVEEILSKNGFLSSYGRDQIPDTYKTTIPYQRFEATHERYFSHYIESKLVRRKELPLMSPGLVKRFRESIFEVFSNAVTHSETELGIFGCGQFFPKGKTIVFSVADLGIGIRRNAKEKAGLDLEPEAAIDVAVNGTFTTKKGPIPGGLGLKLLREFIHLNKGALIIASDKGYWELRHGRVQTKRLQSAFPGTVVTIEINAADTQSYALTSEISASDIF